MAAHRAAHHAGADPTNARFLRRNFEFHAQSTLLRLVAAVERRDEHAPHQRRHQRFLRRARPRDIQSLDMVIGEERQQLIRQITPVR